jgi:hypothetical protein
LLLRKEESVRAYSLKKVKEMVASYNKTKSADSVAEELNLPLRDVKQILVWLHRHDPINKEADKGRSFLLRLPINQIWAQFLYIQDVAAHTAAACLNWPLERLLETCGGPEEWAKHSGRKPIKLHVNDIWNGRESQERRPEDPTVEEIESRKREVHAMWDSNNSSMRGGVPKEPQRVEVREYVYDNRNGTFT